MHQFVGIEKKTEWRYCEELIKNDGCNTASRIIPVT